MLSRFRSLVLRFTARQQLRPVDAAIVAALLLFMGGVAGAALLIWIPENPEAESLFDGDGLRTLDLFLSRVILPGYLVIFLAGLLTRKRWPDSRLLAHAVAQLCALNFAYASYLSGFFTNLFGPTMFFAMLTVGVLLFDVRVVRAGGVTFLAIILATTVGEQLGWLPYAPLFSKAPYEAGHLVTSWLLSYGLTFSVPLVGAALFFLSSMELLRDREQRLGRANALIGRYVPAQLAEKILAGEHTGTEHPERRKVTLFFSDVVGFTNTADQMEAEDLSALLNEYLSEMAAIADAFGATVNQFVGDGIMIFFGAPEVTNDRDHAVRAVRMALAMQQRMAELGEKWFDAGIQTPFRIRVGINTGVASVGDFGSAGRTTYSAIGNQTNLTARIQDHCEPGRILISHTTWALVKDEIPCEEHREIEVKGLHYPVRVYEVVEEASPAAVA